MKEKLGTLKYEGCFVVVIIEHPDDYVICIDTLKHEGEVVNWSWLEGGNIVKMADTFEAYFIGKLEDCL